MADEANTPEGENTTEATQPAVDAGVIVSDSPIQLEAATGNGEIDTLDKDALAAFVAEKFPGRTIDLRKRLDTLRVEVKQLLDGSTQHAERTAAVAEAKEAARLAGTPVLARHKTLRDPDGNLWEFEWNPLYEGNPDLEPVYAE